MIQYFGRLYDNDIEGVDEFSNFQEALDSVDSNKTTGVFNTREKLQMLAPKCEDFILKCKWGGKFFNCSEMIDYRVTSEGNNNRTFQSINYSKLSCKGFCCTFNYVKTMVKGQSNGKSKKPVGIGDLGLTVLLNLSRVDYFYPLKNFVGATALIFDPEEFADSATGGVREVPIEPFQEVRVTIKASTKVAVEEVQRYSVSKRECMFPNDSPEEWNGNYIYGDCLMKCKLKSIIALCKCKMYNTPLIFIDESTSEWPYCTLADIQCLNKYRIKWKTYKPREMIKGLEREIEDSLNCDSCYPLCSSISYNADSTSTQLNFYYENRGSVMYEKFSKLTFIKFLFSMSERR